MILETERLILRQLAEQSEEGIDAFHERIRERMGG